ncbi:UDP-diphospho-muramoylpentapeptide beta-N- acetylglucosaminyltransferase [Cobetia amphilecti]|uniref:undecaprenyldiphospho-muramoylpentapeptide beta-N-acetylglucosaminyltransferase n=1 Tax=Cobetia amphilecti TaxID=1055104 RepID=UPI000501BEE5|nr:MULTISPECIES: undecaprenyldiphospho-muramoylpentapeptide beta-N-acetylglucosaminyltransferase [Cobetia]KGA02813.1 UDP-diphospho-muramoylpentapeptide beta-N- acetylglucosaminyltransferase [Cobetia amphilecti]MDH2420935.1 undecaprenyldiphospho-muramoylpentapeptide beta-N-acetylglucosaminyltransferase [Cobetia litoralis]
MAGGTGGHVIPALSLARALAAAGHEIHWLGSPRGIENRLVPDAGYPLHRVEVAGLRGKGLAGYAAIPFRLARAVLQARRVIRELKPVLVVGLGGFASGPGGLAARLEGIPLIIHEQNAIAGLTNKVLARMATRVYAAFPGAFPPALGAQVVGNPVRDEIADVGAAERVIETAGESRALHLLVMGGSLGAQALNETLAPALALLPEASRPVVRHQAGRDKQEATLAAYQAAGVTAEVSEFIGDMAEAYAWADLVVCRAGALTVAELAAAGRPAVLVPFPHAVDDHQTVNAAVLVKADAARLIPQNTLTAERLAETLAELLDPKILTGMAARARNSAELDAVATMLAGCMETRLER